MNSAEFSLHLQLELQRRGQAEEAPAASDGSEWDEI